MKILITGTSRGIGRKIADFSYFVTVNNKSMTGQDILIDNGELLKSNFIW